MRAFLYLHGAESLQPHGYDPHQGRQEGQRNGYRRLRRPAGSHGTPQRRQRDHRAQIAQPDDRSGTAAQPARQLRRQTRAAHREPLPPFADRRHLHRRQRAAGAGVRTDPRRQREVLAHEVRQPHLGRFRQGQGFGDLRGRDDGAVQRHDHHAVRTARRDADALHVRRLLRRPDFGEQTDREQHGLGLQQANRHRVGREAGQRHLHFARRQHSPPCGGRHQHAHRPL